MADIQKSVSGITVRDMTAADLPGVLELARQLGYPDSADNLSARFRAIRALDGHKLVTARAARDGVVGWMHLCLLTPLEAPPAAQISAIVVDEAWRRGGVGRLLVAYAEEWAAGQGLDRITLRSRDDREAAHDFYRGRGFKAAKRSVVFDKDLK